MTDTKQLMKAVIYTRKGDPDVLRPAERPVPEPGPGEVRVRVHVSAVNPTDWKSRRLFGPSGGPGTEQVPNQDGAGRIDAVGAGVDPGRVGERVWVWEAARDRPQGTAAEYVTLPARQAVPLPEGVSYAAGAAVPIPAMTAHRALTAGSGGPQRLGPGSLAGRTVLVAGGAGAVGNAAIQLARWAGATVLTTVSSPEKAALAQAAGAHQVVDYRTEDAAARIRELAPDGVDRVVEVSPAANAALDVAVLGNGGTVAYYADNGGGEFTLPVRETFSRNLAWHGVLVYTMGDAAKEQAVAAITEALSAGALRAGEEAGLPLHRYPLERTADAHAAVEAGAIGKVLIDVAPAD